MLLAKGRSANLIEKGGRGDTGAPDSVEGPSARKRHQNPHESVIGSARHSKSLAAQCATSGKQTSWVIITPPNAQYIPRARQQKKTFSMWIADGYRIIKYRSVV